MLPCTCPNRGNEDFKEVEKGGTEEEGAREGSGKREEEGGERDQDRVGGEVRDSMGEREEEEERDRVGEGRGIKTESGER